MNYDHSFMLHFLRIDLMFWIMSFVWSFQFHSSFALILVFHVVWNIWLSLTITKILRTIFFPIFLTHTNFIFQFLAKFWYFFCWVLQLFCVWSVLIPAYQMLVHSILERESNWSGKFFCFWCCFWSLIFLWWGKKGGVIYDLSETETFAFLSFLFIPMSQQEKLVVKHTFTWFWFYFIEFFRD